eukprot:TRINITY_DN1418_c0_g1_i1.p1 TRINITY_DN1418_c0_g1~~TRINITY_DN1418_c0_g1_i1.p1  ORF type:complete len:193 (+),score=27.36 TRINITY_DN1418_c0_g1_i1:90-668(+)
MADFVAEGDDWSCENCTYFNKASSICCEMCYRTNTRAKDLDCQWEWQADDQWIPFELPSVHQIEQAFQARQRRVLLSFGFFEENPYYEVVFDYAAGQHFQRNTQSGNRRRVRRLGNDDDSLFQPIEVRQQDDAMCVICQYDFSNWFQNPDTASNKNQQPVKLPSCEGHCFHRECIAQLVKLKSQCPLCARAV